MATEQASALPGLLPFRSCFYYPKLGRFISEDRVGALGDANLYTCVEDNPVQPIDPSGTFPIPTQGPQHPPIGLSFKCNPGDACALLVAKMALFQDMIATHEAWEPCTGRAATPTRSPSSGMACGTARNTGTRTAKCELPKVRPPTPQEIAHLEEL
jgi:RHS repeat-associated protein